MSGKHQRRVWEFEIPVDWEGNVPTSSCVNMCIPHGGVFLTVDTLGEVPQMCFFVDPNAPIEKRIFEIRTIEERIDAEDDQSYYFFDDGATVQCTDGNIRKFIAAEALRVSGQKKMCFIFEVMRGEGI